jgi:hypothetical protein
VCVCFWLVACLGCWDFGSLGCLLQFSSTACATRVFSTDKLRCSSRSGSGGLRCRRFHSGAAPRKVPAQCPSQVQEVSGAVPKVKQVLEDSGVVPRRWGSGFLRGSLPNLIRFRQEVPVQWKVSSYIKAQPKNDQNRSVVLLGMPPKFVWYWRVFYFGNFLVRFGFFLVFLVLSLALLLGFSASLLSCFAASAFLLRWFSASSLLCLFVSPLFCFSFSASLPFLLL